MTTLTDLIISQWPHLSAPARERVLATRAVRDGWMADDGNCEVEYPEADSGLEAARGYVADGDWGEDTCTSWVTVWAWPRYVLGGEVLEGAGEGEREQHLIEVEPAEPECAEGSDGHDWQDERVQGHGGGVVIREECHRCGCTRVIDTWAQHEGTQGLRSVEYVEGDASVDWESIDERCDAITPEHLGADATDDDVAEYCTILRRVGPTHAARDEWERLEESVLAGEHGEWHATDNHVHTETDWESEDDVCDHPRMDGDQCAECGDRCSHRDVGAVADGVCHDHECPIHGTAA